MTSRKNSDIQHPAPPPADTADLELLIFFVTSACNLACESCFYADQTNTKNDMPFSRIETLFNSAGKINTVLLTGGEPFLREDFDKILTLLLPRSFVIINTNGYNPDRIRTSLQNALADRPGQPIMIAVSIDGDKNTHNRLRNNPQSFDRAINSLAVLTELRRNTFPNLTINVNSRIHPENLDQLAPLAESLAKQFDLFYHNFELTRADESVNRYFLQAPQKLRDIQSRLLALIRRYYPSEYAFTKTRFQTQYDTLIDHRPWPIPCLAGNNAVVIYPQGTLAACELRNPTISLADFGDNLPAALRSGGMKNEIESIKNSPCFCTHGCWIQTSWLGHIRQSYGTRNLELILRHRGLIDTLNRLKINRRISLALAGGVEKIRRGLQNLLHP